MKDNKHSILLSEYFLEWIELYKVGAIRPITLSKYYNSQKHLEQIAPRVKIANLNRKTYQSILNDFALTHEKQTTMDFHHQIKSSIMDAIDEGLLTINPTRKVVIKGRTPRDKKPKYLNQFEVQALIRQMNLSSEINWDWFILLIIKTGLRFSEALALTPNDFDFTTQKLTIDKTWDYKSSKGSFQETKNTSSKRKIQLDWQTAMQFSQLTRNLDDNSLIFVSKRVHNSTVNNRLQTLCQHANVPSISIHGLRHTHASLLLFAGVSIATVARRLGHSSMSTTQETYLHIIHELENQDNDKIMHHLSTLI